MAVALQSVRLPDERLHVVRKRDFLAPMSKSTSLTRREGDGTGVETSQGRSP
jgi:hypothetical protein